MFKFDEKYLFFIKLQLLNRQKRSKKKAPVPLTADMLNELNKNHMGGFENYGNEELYIEDTWDDIKPDFKPKVSVWRTDRKIRFRINYSTDFFTILEFVLISSDLQTPAAIEMNDSIVGEHSKSTKQIKTIIMIRNCQSPIIHNVQ